MKMPVRGGVLLALDAGVWESGWAVFSEKSLELTGVIRAGPRRRSDTHGRIRVLVESLDKLIDLWRPAEVVHSLPSGIRWRAPSLELLDFSLAAWAKKHELALHGYTAQEVRSAIAGHPNTSRDELGYAVMLRLGLIGQAKSTHEWEAVAVGYYHIRRRPAGASRLAGSGV